MVDIVGNVKNVRRFVSGMYSFDRAFANSFGDIGLPIGVGIEVFGGTNCGKSTFVFSLSGMIAAQEKTNIAIADLEGFDPEFMRRIFEASGFSGKVFLIQDKTDEDTLDSLIKELRNETTGIGILDSVGAISPVSEQKGELGEANMGRRALLMAQFSRKILPMLRDVRNYKTFFAINHAYPKVGGMGMDTPGGEVKKFIFSVRIQVGRAFYKNKFEEYPDGSYVLEGKVVKNRWGLRERKFWVFVLGGHGIHRGLTDLYDCKRLGYVSVENGIIRIEGKSVGRLSELVNKARQGNEEAFNDFSELLKAGDDSRRDESAYSDIEADITNEG